MCALQRVTNRESHATEASAIWEALSDMLARRSLDRARIGIDHVGASTQADEALGEILSDIADLFGADRAYIIEDSEDYATARITYEWCCRGVAPVRGRLGEMPSDVFPWLRERLAEDELLFVPSVDLLPPAAAAEREELSRRGAASTLATPLQLGHGGIGMVGFEWGSPRQEAPVGRREMFIVRAVLSSALHERRSVAVLDANTRAVEAMIECGDALLRAKDERALLEEICRIIVEVGGYQLAWVGVGQQDEGRSVTPVAKWGDEASYLDEVEVTWAQIESGNGPVSRAVRTGRPAAVQSVATDPDFEPWRGAALARGFKSILAVALDFGGGTLGALGVYSDRAEAFDHGEVEMMQRFADYLSYGIVVLRTRASREEAEAKLREALQSKDQLVASISHELRTPLTAVVGFAQVLHESTDLASEERKAMVRSIVEQSLDVTNIVEDLLTVAKAESGTLSVVRVPVDLRAQAAQVVETLGSDAAPKVALTGGSRRAMADPGRVRQILRNLVSNALRYGGDRIVVEICIEGPLRVRVVDDGPGIPERDRERIFESYQKAHDTPGLAGSIGLGLAISRTLARLMGGDLTYQYLAGRSVFELSLPS